MTAVSVILPCYNAGDYLPLAIESVINQTFRDFEVIAIDDYSTDNTLQTLLLYAEKDSRIHVIKNSENLGLIKTLNKGIDLATGKYIARMDQDDICLPERLEKQIEFLENNNDIDLVSCRWFVIDENGTKIQKNLPRTFTTKSNLLESFFGPPFGHPTVTMKTSVVKKYYYRFSENTKHIEDYDLWSRMLLDGIKTKVMNEFLFQYRNFSGNTTHKHHATQSKNMIFVATQNLKDFLGIEIEESIRNTVFNRQETNIGTIDLIKAVKQFTEITESFIKKTRPNADELKQIKHFSANHITDILFQYILKNENPSYLTVMKLASENLSLLMDSKNLYYSYIKFLSLFRRRFSKR